MTAILLTIWSNIWVIVSSTPFDGSIQQIDSVVLVKYKPMTNVTDFIEIDLDQAVIEDQLSELSDEGFKNALRIYEEGGHSKAYAELYLDEIPPNPIPAGSEFIGLNVYGEQIKGIAYKNQQSNILKLKYENSDKLCNVGGLTVIGAEKTEGCFASSGLVDRINTEDSDFSYNYYGLRNMDMMLKYSYNMFINNKNARTIQSFSERVQPKMLKCERFCPHRDAEYFHKYYETASYGDQWIQAAFSSTATTFKKGGDFSNVGHAGRAEFIKKATVTMNIFMYVIHEFEKAVNYCEDSQDDALKSWDKAVALYTGSIEGENGSAKGKLLHQLADDSCVEFKTCGENGNESTGMSKLNFDMLELFRAGQFQIFNKMCGTARNTERKIVDLMYIPLIQGALHNAYKVNYQGGSALDKNVGAVFAASVLPRIHADNKEAAEIIYDNMRIGATTTSYDDVAIAFQSLYEKLNINCNQIGGIWNKSTGKYHINADPCSEAGHSIIGVLLGTIFGVIIATMAVIAAYFFSGNKKSEDENVLFSISNVPEFS